MTGEIVIDCAIILDDLFISIVQSYLNKWYSESVYDISIPRMLDVFTSPTRSYESMLVIYENYLMRIYVAAYERNLDGYYVSLNFIWEIFCTEYNKQLLMPDKPLHQVLDI